MPSSLKQLKIPDKHAFKRFFELYTNTLYFIINRLWRSDPKGFHTIAHSFTLALSVLDIVTLNSSYVEIAIAFSIVYIAVENLWELSSADSRKSSTLVWRRRLSVTFLFGLIHGFGFSYILQEMGLRDQVAGALLFFNLGVETGQLFILFPAFALLTFAVQTKTRFSFSRVTSVAVGLAGLFWFIERVGTII